jgi:3-phenylpropionate/cinnamic acid dioxygenase small subunit
MTKLSGTILDGESRPEGRGTGTVPRNGPKLNSRLLEEVVILENGEAVNTGARTLAPDHSPRAAYAETAVPGMAIASSEPTSASLQHRVQQFLYYQSELLDGKHWRAFIDLFTEDGVYWMPATPDQTEWLDSPSIFSEDRSIMTIRADRLTHPNAWSQAAEWGTSHIVANVCVESETPAEVLVRSRFIMHELRRDTLRTFAGRYRHWLIPTGDSFRIKLQRVDMVNAQAPYEYVLQTWV